MPQIECNLCWRRFVIEGEPPLYCPECDEGLMHYTDPKDVVKRIRQIEKKLHGKEANAEAS